VQVLTARERGGGEQISSQKTFSLEQRKTTQSSSLLISGCHES